MSCVSANRSNGVIDDFSVGINGALRPFPVLNTSAFIDATVAALLDTGVNNLPRSAPSIS